MRCWIKTSHGLIVAVRGTSVFKLRKGKSTLREGGGGHADFHSVRSRERSVKMLGPELVPFPKGSSSCWFRWWNVNLPQRKALFQLNYMSGEMAHRQAGAWWRVGLGWQCGWSLRCRAGVGCEEQPRAPEDVKRKSNKISCHFTRITLAAVRGDQGAPRME